MPDCPIDARPTDTVLCPGCLDQVRTELRQVPWLTRQLDITLTRQARTGDRNGPRSTDHPLPYHHGASVDIESLRDGLAYWAGQVAQRRGVTVDTPHSPPGYARWLLRWPSEIAGHPDAAELHGDVLALTHAARRTIDRHPDLRYLGPCDTCGHDLYATVHAVTVDCQGDLAPVDAASGDLLPSLPCEAVYEIAPRRIWLLEQAADQLRTARQLSFELPWIAGVTVTAERIGMWAKRGKVTIYLPHPLDERQAQRFRVGEIIEHARAMAVEQNSRVSGAASARPC